MVGASVDGQVTINPNLLAETLEEVDQKVKAILRLMEEEWVSVEKDGVSYVRKPELVAHVEEFHKTYKSLAKSFDHLTGESFKSPEVSVSVEESAFFTPAPKLGPNKFDQKSIEYDTILSSGDGSSSLSFKEGSQSSSSESSDSESESFVSAVNKHSNSHEDYAALVKQLDTYKKDLEESNRKLLKSEEEVAYLNNELKKKKKESATVLVGDLQAQLESLQSDIKVGEAELEVEKITVLMLQEKLAELESHVVDSDSTIQALVKELEITREDLKERTDMLSDRDHEMKELKTALGDAHENFSLENEKLQSDISVLSKLHEDKEEKLNCLHEAQRVGLCGEIERLKADAADRGELVEALNKNLDILKVKYDMLVAEKEGLDATLETLKAEMCLRDEKIQKLEERNVGLIAGSEKAIEFAEEQKLRIVAEKEGVEATLQALKAEMCLREEKIQELEERKVGMIAESEKAIEIAEEQKLRIRELEEEVNRLRIVIQERAEEKIEAIKQLCFSLEHYRSGYQELRQAFTGYKHRAVSAA